MGIEAILLTTITAASGLAQRSQQRRASRAATTQNRINTASGQIENTLARRRAAREERVRRARLKQSASNTGISESSGVFGAVSSLRTNADGAIAGQEGQRLAAAGISAALQRRADAESAINSIRSFQQLGTTLVGAAKEADLFPSK